MDDNKDDDEFSKYDSVLIDIDVIAKNSRIKGIMEFNTRYKNEGLTIVDNTKTNPKDRVNPSTWSEAKLNEILPVEELHIIIKNNFEYNKDEEKYVFNAKGFWIIIEEIVKVVFYKTCEYLSDAGIYELAFDGDNDRFVWIFKNKKLQQPEKKKRGRPRKKPPESSP